jgi:hypothetical protein
MKRLFLPVAALGALVIALLGSGDARVPSALRRSRSEAARALELDATSLGELVAPARARVQHHEVAAGAIAARPLALVAGSRVRRLAPAPLVPARPRCGSAALPASRAPPLA